MHIQGVKVKVTMQFKGREIFSQDGANEMMQVYSFHVPCLCTHDSLVEGGMSG